MMDVVGVGDATIAVTSPLPAAAGTDLVIRVAWPSASGGQKARIELHRRTNAPNGTGMIVASVQVDPGTLRSGSAEARLAVPLDSPPSFDGAGLEVSYIIRVLVDRRFQPDAAIERPVAIV